MRPKDGGDARGPLAAALAPSVLSPPRGDFITIFLFDDDDTTLSLGGLFQILVGEERGGGLDAGLDLSPLPSRLPEPPSLSRPLRLLRDDDVAWGCCCSPLGLALAPRPSPPPGTLVDASRGDAIFEGR